MLTHTPRKWLRIGQTDVHWVELGDGPPTVLLHGLNDSHRTWDKLAPALAGTRRVLMPDLPGHGLSGRPDASYSLAWHADTIGAWMEALGLEDVDLVGHSFGGGVAQFLLLRHRARVRRLALVAPGGLGREVMVGLRLAALPRVIEELGQPFMAAGTRAAMRQLGAHFEEEDIEWLAWANSMPGTARAFARTVRDVIDVGGQRRHFLDHAHGLASLPPIGMFWGDRDNVIPVAHGVTLFDELEGLSLTRFADCGHFPHRERPAEMASALSAFFAEETVAATRLRRRPVPRRARPGLVRRAFSGLATLLGRWFGPTGLRDGVTSA